MKIYLISLLSLLLLLGCGPASSTLPLGQGQDVVVTLEGIDSEQVDQIVFQANGTRTVATAADLKGHTAVAFGFNTAGENSFQVCVYAQNDSTCTEQYVEKGYQPTLRYANQRLELVDAGLGY